GPGTGTVGQSDPALEARPGSGTGQRPVERHHTGRRERPKPADELRPAFADVEVADCPRPQLELGEKSLVGGIAHDHATRAAGAVRAARASAVARAARATRASAVARAARATRAVAAIGAHGCPLTGGRNELG